MKRFLKKMTFSRRKYIPPKMKSTKNSTESLLFSFKNYIIDKLDFDDVSIFKERFDKSSVNSIYMNVLGILFDYDVNLYKKKLAYFNDFFSGNNHDVYIYTFKMFRDYGHQSETRYMIGYISRHNSLIFIDVFDPTLFSHFKKDDLENNILTSSNYIYCPHDSFYGELLTYNISTALIKDNFRNLSLNKGKEFYFPPYRTYDLILKINIDSQEPSKDASLYILYNNKILKILDAYIYNEYSFQTAVDRILFPFNLDDSTLTSLGLSSITLDDISKNFDKEYELKKMIDI